MESVIEPKIAHPRAIPVAADELREIEERVAAYLAAAGAPADLRSQLAAHTLQCLAEKLARGGGSDPRELAIDEAASLLRQRLAEDAVASPAFENDEWRRALRPDRPIETNLRTMETSLSRLPTGRLIAGWFALILALILAFIFTH